MTNTKIAAVVVTYNGAEWIADCLKSLRDHACTLLTIVVDNSSADTTVEIVERDFPEVFLIQLQKNVGFGVGNNVGIRKAMDWGAEYVLLLNQDAYVLPNTIVNMADFLSGRPEYGACSPLHCSPDEHHLDGKTFRYYLTRYAGEYLRDAAMGCVKEFYTIHGVNAAVWFFRTKTFRYVGGFDPLFFMYGEDDDMLTRMAYHKIKFALLPRIRVVHQRQSPLVEVKGFWARLKRLTRRRYSGLLTEMKLPQRSIFYMVMMLVSRGLIRPLADVLEDRDGETWLASCSATLLAAWRLPSIWRSVRVTRLKGAHFLN